MVWPKVLWIGSQIVSIKAASKIRCAIYTRKSSEEGLDQEFNSLDAQREACEAYVLSQRHEGWVALPAMYDDGGISGGTMERPALKHLLTDIEAKRVDTVVVYKVDRLTRSLSDFAKIVDSFDRNGVSFVSVTQQFNTTSSMGRLTLNMLLSFAQFEREVTGERIRDKIAASKKKGMWMGGTVPLGYEVKDRKLEINKPEAERVRQIFETYLELGSVAKLRQELFQLGIHPRAKNASGSKKFSCGALYTLLQNSIYIGKTRHKDLIYDGLHEPIIGENLWDQVQRRISYNRVARRNGNSAKSPSLLAGLIIDQHGHGLTPSHANKNGRRYRYYVTKPNVNSALSPTNSEKLSIPAGELERLVCERLIGFLSDEGEIANAMAGYDLSASELEFIISKARVQADGFHDLGPQWQRELLIKMIQSIQIFPEHIEIVVDPSGLLKAVSSNIDNKEAKLGQPDKLVTLSIKASLQRCGIEKRLVIDGPQQLDNRQPDKALLQLFSRAHLYKDMLLQSNNGSISELAEKVGVTSSYFSRIVRLGFLAPDIISALTTGKQPFTLTARQLAHDTNLAINWAEQREQLGIAKSK